MDKSKVVFLCCSTLWIFPFIKRIGITLNCVFPSYAKGKGACVQLWYHMYGKGVGTLNVYQESEEGKQALIFSQRGDQGRLWRFAQAALLPQVQPYRVSHEDLPRTVW